MAVQSCHAIADFAADHPQTFKKWKEESNSIICLSVPDKTELLKLYDKFKGKTPTTKFYEPDVDEFTAICLYGTKEIRKSLSHLPLCLKEYNYQREKIIQECIDLVESMVTPNCHDHTPFYGPCVTCGQSDNYDTLPDPEYLLEQLKELKNKK